MKAACTLLFSSAGRRVELIRCFRRDASALGIDLKVVAVDMNPRMSPACVEADLAFAVPRCTDPSFVSRMIELCSENTVDMIIPTIDPELQVFSEHAELFRRINTDICVSSAEVIRIASDKQETCRHFCAHRIPVPRTGQPSELYGSDRDWNYPVILKPLNGSASVAVHTVGSACELPPAAELEGYVVQELLRGREYTVNLFFDATGELRTAIPHWRCETRSGEVSKAITERRQDLAAISQKIGRCLPGPRGALCYQAIVTEAGRVGVFELNARFGGGYPLAHHAGAAFSKWLLEEATGRACSADNNWTAGISMLRYDAAFFTMP